MRERSAMYLGREVWSTALPCCLASLAARKSSAHSIVWRPKTITPATPTRRPTSGPRRSPEPENDEQTDEHSRCHGCPASPQLRRTSSARYSKEPFRPSPSRPRTSEGWRLPTACRRNGLAFESRPSEVMALR
jgi:hypothetical protein